MLRVSLFASVVVLATALPAAADTVCTGRLSGSFENIDVPAGKTCTLINADVDGSIKVYGALKVLDGRRGTRIDGSIQAEPGNLGVGIGRGVEINGDVQVVGAFGPTAILSAFVNGSIQVKQGYARLVIRDSTVGGDVQFEQTNVRGAVNSGAIFANSIDGNLQCQANTPPPIGDENVVGGNKEDQCANF